MTGTRLIGTVCGKIIDQIVRALSLSRIHPNVLTFLGLLINIWAAFLLAAAAPMNFLNAVVFALETSDGQGFQTLVAHFVAHFTATLMAAGFVFAALVTVRGTIALIGGPRLAAGAGSFFQFIFVVALLSFVVLSPAVWKIPSAMLNNPVATGWLPTSWFLGLFERLRGSSRAYFVPLGIRALVATPIAVAGAILVSIFGFRHHMQFALTRPTRPDGLGIARLVRRIGRIAAGRDVRARAISDFVLLTIARNRSLHTPVAMNLAAGVAIGIAGLTRSKTIAGLMQPRTIVLWIPLLIGYWLTIGMRASAFVSSELPAAWAFRSIAPPRTRAYWSGTRAALLAVVLPAALMADIALITPLLGWRVALWHGVFVAVVLVALVELVALTIRHVPFTWPYRPGHARLRTRWPLYVVGMYAVAYWPVQFELRLMDGGGALLLAAVTACAGGCHLAGRRAALTWLIEPPEELAHDEWDVAVLDIGRVVHGAHVGG